MWGWGGRWLEQRRVEKSSVVLPGSKWLSASEELPHAISQATQKHQWGAAQSHGVCLPTWATALLRYGCQETMLLSAPAKPGPMKSWWPTEKPLRFLGFLGLDVGSRIHYLEGQLSWPTSCYSSLVRNPVLPPHSATASHRSLPTVNPFNHHMAQIFQNITSF